MFFQVYFQFFFQGHFNEPGSNIVNHAWSNEQNINFEESSVIDKGNYQTRKTLSLVFIYFDFPISANDSDPTVVDKDSTIPVIG